MKERFDSNMMGINFGILAPILAACLYYLLQFMQITFGEYLDFIARPDILPSILSICLLANLAAFFLCLRYSMNRAAYGIIFSTLLYGAVIIVLKFA